MCDACTRERGDQENFSHLSYTLPISISCFLMNPSPLTTAPYHTLAPDPTVTEPMRELQGATNDTEDDTWGEPALNNGICVR